MPNILLLVPTDLERQAVAAALDAAGPGFADIHLCGFGPVAAAARTAGLVAARRPDRVMLVGIAGRLDERLAVGAAYRFDEVGCFGVGAGTGSGFVTADGLGWPHWPGDPADERAAIGDVIRLGRTPQGADRRISGAGLLLTVCAAAADLADVADRRRLFPAAVAEDMEGFGVAVACRLAGVPLEIVRGISNTAGDREGSRWRIAEALAAAAGLVRRLVEASR